MCKNQDSWEFKSLENVFKKTHLHWNHINLAEKEENRLLVWRVLTRSWGSRRDIHTSTAWQQVSVDLSKVKKLTTTKLSFRQLTHHFSRPTPEQQNSPFTGQQSLGTQASGLFAQEALLAADNFARFKKLLVLCTLFLFSQPQFSMVTGHEPQSPSQWMASVHGRKEAHLARISSFVSIRNTYLQDRCEPLVKCCGNILSLLKIKPQFLLSPMNFESSRGDNGERQHKNQKNHGWVLGTAVQEFLRKLIFCISRSWFKSQIHFWFCLPGDAGVFQAWAVSLARRKVF